jgi:hypothetical protein
MNSTKKGPVEARERAYTIPEFCEVEHWSLSTYYKRQRRGLGPEETRYPDSPMVRITPEQRRAFHEKMQALSQTYAEELEQHRRSAYAVQAGRAAAASPLHISKRRKATSRSRR